MTYTRVSFASSWIIVLFLQLQAAAQVEIKSSGIKRNVQTGRWQIGPDPTSHWALLQLFPENSDMLSGYLGLKEEEVAALRKLAADSRQEEQRLMQSPDFTWAKAQEFRGSVLNTADEAINPERWELLSRAAYRFEIQKLGLAFALVNGRLGHAAGVHDQQHEMLTRELAKIEANAKKKIAEIREAAELEAFNLLTPEQRDKALGLVAGTYELAGATDEQRAILKFVNEHEGNIPRSK